MWKAHHMWCISGYPVMIPVHMQCQVVHPFPPVVDSGSRVLILGSFPSVKSRQDGFYYAHPRNRFWPMMEKLFSCRLADMEEKKALLHRAHIALWDSIASCTITGSSDSSIRDVVAADIGGLVGSTCIDTILANGTKSYGVYMRYVYPSLGMPAVKMPSTSPANASWSLDRLVEAWRGHLVPIVQAP